MSPDARLIAAAIRMGTGTSYKVAVADVANLEENLREKFPDSDRGIRGMVPVGWVNQMLDELFSVAARVTPQPVPVAEKIISIRTQLTQFQEDV